MALTLQLNFSEIKVGRTESTNSFGYFPHIDKIHCFHNRVRRVHLAVYVCLLKVLEDAAHNVFTCWTYSPGNDDSFP